MSIHPRDQLDRGLEAAIEVIQRRVDEQWRAVGTVEFSCTLATEAGDDGLLWITLVSPEHPLGLPMILPAVARAAARVIPTRAAIWVSPMEGEPDYVAIEVEVRPFLRRIEGCPAPGVSHRLDFTPRVHWRLTEIEEWEWVTLPENVAHFARRYPECADWVMDDHLMEDFTRRARARHAASAVCGGEEG